MVKLKRASHQDTKIKKSASPTEIFTKNLLKLQKVNNESKQLYNGITNANKFNKILVSFYGVVNAKRIGKIQQNEILTSELISKTHKIISAFTTEEMFFKESAKGYLSIFEKITEETKSGLEINKEIEKIDDKLIKLNDKKTKLSNGIEILSNQNNENLELIKFLEKVEQYISLKNGTCPIFDTLCETKGIIDLATKEISINKNRLKNHKIDLNQEMEGHIITQKNKIDENTKKIDLLNKKLGGINSELDRFETDIDQKTEVKNELISSLSSINVG